MLARRSVSTKIAEIGPEADPVSTARVAAGSIAERYLKLAYGVEIVAFVSSVGKIHMPQSKEDEDVDDEEYLNLLQNVTRDQVDENLIRCPHKESAAKMEQVSREVPYPEQELTPPSHSESSRPRRPTTPSAVRSLA